MAEVASQHGFFEAQHVHTVLCGGAVLVGGVARLGVLLLHRHPRRVHMAEGEGQDVIALGIC